MGNTLANRIVGRPVEAVPPIPAQANPESAYKELDTQTNRLEKRVNHLETLLKHTQKQIEDAVQKGDKSTAVRLLARVKEQEASIKSHQAMVQRLIQQRDLLEKTTFQTDTLRVMDHVNQHLKRTAVVSIETAESIMEDITETKQNADEVMNILATPINDGVSQAELEQEYQAMVAQAAAKPILLPKPPMPPTALPVLPEPPVTVQAKPTILAELEAV
jgi:hypothetical protein